MEQKMIRLEPKVNGKYVSELRREFDILHERLTLIQELKVSGQGVPKSVDMVLPEMTERYLYLKRITKSWDSPLYFMYEYFSDDLNPANEGNIIPEGVGVEDAPHFHKTLCDTLHVLNYDEVTKRVAWSVPRGHA